jgi:hypothetical protein
LPWIGLTVIPGVPGSAMKALMSWVPLVWPPVRAVKTIAPAWAALVIHILVPSTTHSSPSRTAVVRVAPASEPASGSLNP